MQKPEDYRNDILIQQAFLNELDEKLWSAADRLRQQLDAANYKHIVLGLIFLKYISDSFTAQQEKIRAALTDAENPLYLDRTFYDSEEDYEAALSAELENRDYYIADNIFWVPLPPAGKPYNLSPFLIPAQNYLGVANSPVSPV